MYRTTRLAMLALVVAASLVAVPVSTAATDAQHATAPAVADEYGFDDVENTAHSVGDGGSAGELRVTGYELRDDRIEPGEPIPIRARLAGDGEGGKTDLILTLDDRRIDLGTVTAEGERVSFDANDDLAESIGVEVDCDVYHDSEEGWTVSCTITVTVDSLSEGEHDVGLEGLEPTALTVEGSNGPGDGGSNPPADVQAASTMCQSGIGPFQDNVGFVLGGSCWMVENEQLWIVGDCGETATVICYGMTENDDEEPPTAAGGLESGELVGNQTVRLSTGAIDEDGSQNDTVRRVVTYEGDGSTVDGRNVVVASLETGADGESHHLGNVVAAAVEPGSNVAGGTPQAAHSGVTLESGAGSQAWFLPAEDTPESIGVHCEIGYDSEDGWYVSCEITLQPDSLSPGSGDGADGEANAPGGATDVGADPPFPLRSTGPYLPTPI